MDMRQRLEENGIFEEPDEHFEMWKTKIYIIQVKKKEGSKFYNRQIAVPVDIVRHLNLKHKDEVLVAIRKTENTTKDATQ